MYFLIPQTGLKDHQCLVFRHRKPGSDQPKPSDKLGDYCLQWVEDYDIFVIVCMIIFWNNSKILFTNYYFNKKKSIIYFFDIENE